MCTGHRRNGAPAVAERGRWRGAPVSRRPCCCGSSSASVVHVSSAASGTPGPVREAGPPALKLPPGEAWQAAKLTTSTSRWRQADLRRRDPGVTPLSLGAGPPRPSASNRMRRPLPNQAPHFRLKALSRQATNSCPLADRQTLHVHRPNAAQNAGGLRHPHLSQSGTESLALRPLADEFPLGPWPPRPRCLAGTRLLRCLIRVKSISAGVP
jgi:hypothetical protein